MFLKARMQDDHGMMIFSYVESWLEKPNAMPLSQSLPLREEPFEAKHAKGFSVAFCLKKKSVN